MGCGFSLNCSTWMLRGQHLTVYDGSKFLRRCNNKNFQSQISSQQRHNLKYSFSEYKMYRSAFWRDVPHHKSKPVREKVKTVKLHSSSKITKQSHQENGSQSLKSSKSGHSGKSKQSITVNKRTARDYDSERFLRHCILNDAPIDTNVPVTTESDSIPEESSKTVETPVYMMYQESHTLLQLTSLTYNNIIYEIGRHTSIPYSLLLLYHHGKRLHGNMLLDIQPYDSINVLVKGVGGMRNEDNPEYVTEKSSEDEVTNWLIQSLGFTADLVERYNLKELNGKLLYKYSLESLDEFASVLPNIPIGLLRKILILRNPSEKTRKILTLKEGKWKCEDVETFVRQTLKGTKEKVDQICSFIHEKAIDGVVLFSYLNFKDIQKDFSSSEEYGLQFDKIITTKEEILDCIQENKTKLKKGGLHKPYSDVTKFVPFLQDRLKLDKVSENQNITPKSLNLSIIYNTWKSKNELESKVLFLILCENSVQLDSETQRILWSKIRQNLRVWRQHFDDAPSRALFEESDDNECLFYNGERISLSNEQPQMRPIMDKFKNPQDLSSISNIFLLIDCKTFDKVFATYEINLQIPGEEPVLYQFSFRKGMKYWQFDHQNAAKGFWSSSLITEDSEIPENPVNYISQVQSHRPFLASGEEIQYIAGKVFPTCESGGTLADRCFEYKYFASSLITIDKAISKFLIETLRFACGVLNVRKNGTIAFGIGDDVSQIDGRQLKHGEIVGFCIQQISKDFKPKFTDALDNAVNKCFHDASKIKAAMCIGDPVFIPVVTSGRERVLYVMEVDIQPSTDKCNGTYFKLNRSKLDNVGDFKKLEKDFTLFVRKGSATEKITEKAVEKTFIQKTLENIIKQRKIFDERIQQSKKQPLELPMDKLRRLLCNGLDQFDSSFYPFLVMSKPTVGQKRNPKWIQNMQFIRAINFYCIFDFDDYSNVDGLCFNYRNKMKSDMHSEDIFEDFSNRFTKLQASLGFPHDPKTVWVFANGRNDVQPVRPHYDIDSTSWSSEYLGIRDAVFFYSQIIPKRRAMFIFLLFSDDFVGLIETLNECILRFGWDRIIIITTEVYIFNNIRKILVGEKRSSEEDITRRSIYGEGFEWEHICSTFCQSTGQSEEILKRVPVYSGGDGVPMDQHFQDAMTDLDVLSTTLCKSSSQGISETFSLKIEKQFYKGGKVNWFNFALDHICTRHIFKQLKTYIQRSLSYGHENRDQIAIAITIAYQPGAGVSTLARHLLWEFHDRYRCAIIKRLTGNTVSNIISLWQYKETSKRNPLLLLVDDLSDPDYYPQQLPKMIQNHFNKNKLQQQGTVCCIIICQRGVEDVQRKPTCSSPFIEHSETLRHKLTDEEIQWFENKFKQIEHRKHSYLPDNLISFLILRKDFDSTYIKNTISNLLTTIDESSKEYELLSFVSLISHYGNRSYNTKRVCIPIECCDEFIGTKYTKGKAWEFWEKNMEEDKKIFLIVEENRNYSTKYIHVFKEIRISHPSIAPVVLDVLTEHKLSLSDLTLKFLESSVLTNNSVTASSIIEYKAKEMLKRRLKEEYNDKENTAYSPLIERITKDEGWKHAEKVLKKGLELFEDCYIYQTLSKLLSNNKQYDDAIKYAQESKKYASTIEEKGFCYQSLGLAMRDKFESNINDYVDIEKSGFAVKSLLEAFELFLEARQCVESVGEISVLYCTHDILRTILLCGQFLLEKANFPAEINRKRLLTDPLYDVSELPDPWKEVKKTLTTLVSHGQYSFELIQRKLCFEPIYYSHDPQKLHRFHRRLHFEYPKLLNKFIQIFGEGNGEPPSDSLPAVVDEWHRRKVLSFMGNNYMDLYNRIYLQHRRKCMELERAFSICLEIRGHLVAIINKEVRDYINLVSVNFLLSSLKSCGVKRAPLSHSIKELIGFCQIASATPGEYADQAYFFLSMMLWPTDEENKNVDIDLFQKVLNNFLIRKPKRFSKKREQREIKGEHNITRPTPQFFLGYGKGLNKFCHRFDIYVKPSAGEQFDDGKIWHRENVRRKIRRVEGYIQYNQSWQYISVKTNMSPDNEVQIHKIRKCSIKSEEEVTFVLGFSIAGPIAYDVQLKENPETYVSPVEIDEDKTENYYNKSDGELSDLIIRIQQLKVETEQRDLHRDEKYLLEDEQYIRDALELKREDFDRM
ncbi:Hypothetical predicted protein [Mytilus galloprovincialis]|uniref:Schlafen AlbA-2 domain-containing protein n=1 Tax=Mytilus galloprovincialis TaxID=29158 RepID=A0A8B6C6V4_MYTGA|nr:Hypothetical predicted protein [Mytilus galloprovincialis]